ncbi:MAG: hypothetical protein FJ320_07675 [SAR202 cluster bacterium]|nr:hypothetical protein [SAR202 cluster bacterium]
MAIYLKTCKKCRGDLFLNGDIYGPYLQCLQCGLLIEIKAKKSAGLEQYAEAVQQQQIAA